MGIFGWFNKREVVMVEDTVIQEDTYSKKEVDALINTLVAELADIKVSIEDNKKSLSAYVVNLDSFVGMTNTRFDILQKEIEKNNDTSNFVTIETVNPIVESLVEVKEQLEACKGMSGAIVDPAPIPVSPPMGWMNALRDEVMQQSQIAKMEMKSYVDDCFTAYDANEDAELEQRLANLSPISPEEIDALYMDEAETTTLAQKTLNGFRAEVYNKALADIKLIPTSRATVAAVRAFLVKFVESMKPV
jgi:hypothetical protein